MGMAGPAKASLGEPSFDREGVGTRRRPHSQTGLGGGLPSAMAA
jgi:hypothetical protein